MPILIRSLAFSSATVRRSWRFVLIGVLVAAVYTLGFQLLRGVAHVSDTWAAAIAYVGATAVHYVGQASFTFERQIVDSSQIGRYLATVAFGFLYALALVSIGGKVSPIGATLATVLVVVTLPFVNFIVYSLWVFGREKRGDAVS